jgi:hypothetical protein
LRPGGMGERLQIRLNARARAAAVADGDAVETGKLENTGRELDESIATGRTSWLQLWWNRLSFLDVRGPTPIHVSYFLRLQDPPNCVCRPGAGVARAAELASRMLRFRRRVADGTLSPDTRGRGTRKAPMCATAYKYMFSACRVPGSGSALTAPAFCHRSLSKL